LNPLCGDHIWVSLEVKDEHVQGIAFEGQSCAICKASASMMTANVKGKSVAEAEQLVAEFRDMATGKLDVARQPNHLGRLSVFAESDLPRVKARSCPGIPCTRRSSSRREPDRRRPGSFRTFGAKRGNAFTTEDTEEHRGLNAEQNVERTDHRFGISL
jgi:hypothetical protein